MTYFLCVGIFTKIKNLLAIDWFLWKSLQSECSYFLQYKSCELADVSEQRHYKLPITTQQL